MVYRKVEHSLLGLTVLWRAHGALAFGAPPPAVSPCRVGTGAHSCSLFVGISLSDKYLQYVLKFGLKPT